MGARLWAQALWFGFCAAVGTTILVVVLVHPASAGTRVPLWLGLTFLGLFIVLAVVLLIRALLLIRRGRLGK
jgi:hypothetical protein